jgi:tetratricopeptide (TPR) repeat protein
MKKLIILALITLFCFNLLTALEPALDKINQEAIQAYQNKDYYNALQKFLVIDNNGVINADLYYNIANCYFRQNSLGMSILYYEKCLKVQPSHIAAQKNRDFAMTLIRDKIEKEDPSAVMLLLHKLYNSIDLNSAALLSLILWALLIFILIIMKTAFRNKDKSLPVFLAFLILIMLIVSGTISYTKYSSYHSKDDAVIVAGTAIGFSGPGEEYTRVFTIHEGMRCHIEDTSNNWQLIKLENGLGGWIQKDLLALVAF